MVSKASEDLPEPESPVITTRRSRGISRSRFLRLCSRAPLIMIRSAIAVLSDAIFHCTQGFPVQKDPLPYSPADCPASANYTIYCCDWPVTPGAGLAVETFKSTVIVLCPAALRYTPRIGVASA